MKGATVTYSGTLTPKTMKLDLNVAMPQSKWGKSYGLSGFTKGKKMIVGTSGGQYVWKESSSEILTGAFYVHLDDVELTKSGNRPRIFIGIYVTDRDTANIYRTGSVIGDHVTVGLQGD